MPPAATGRGRGTEELSWMQRALITVFSKSCQWPDATWRNAAAVLAITAVALAVSLPNFILDFCDLYGDGGVSLDGMRVVSVARDRRVPSAFKIGDVIQPEKVPLNERFEGSIFERFGPVGPVFWTPIVRNGRAMTVPITFENHPDPNLTRDIAIDAVHKTLDLLLALLGAALAILRPTRISWAFFFYTAGVAGLEVPEFWSFLPSIAYTCVACIWFCCMIAASAAFCIFALRVGGAFKPRTQRLLERAVVTAIVPIVALVAFRIVLLYTKPSVFDDLVSVCETGLAVILAFGIAVFVWGTVRKIRTGMGLPVIGSLCFAAAGLALLTNMVLNESLFDLPENGSIPLLPFIPLYDAALYFPLSLAGAYVMIRSRTLDVRLTVSRAAAFAGLCYAVVAIVVALNWGFAERVVDVQFLLPLELLLAVWLGYRLSGLHDIARTQALATSEAAAARLRGNLSEEKALFAKAFAVAELSRKTNLVAEVRARMAFSAWLDGDQSCLAENLEALATLIGTAPARGLQLFLAAARHRSNELVPSASDLAEWVCRAHLMSSANAADTCAALLFAREAAQAADQSGQPFLQLLALIAISELAPSVRDTYVARLRELASESGSAALRDSVRAYEEGADDALGMLSPFIVKFRPAPAVKVPALEVRFLTAEVRVAGVAVELREAERALLFAIAHRSGPVSSDTLADELWPERDGDAAKNALRVCLHRLRRGLGSPDSIIRSGSGYALSPHSVVDLHELPVIPRSYDASLTASQRASYLAALERLHATESARLAAGRWFDGYAIELKKRFEMMTRYLARDASRRHAPGDVLEFLQPFLQSDAADGEVREWPVAARPGNGSTIGP
jgi:hypothetical protein